MYSGQASIMFIFQWKRTILCSTQKKWREIMREKKTKRKRNIHETRKMQCNGESISYANCLCLHDDVNGNMKIYWTDANV